MPICNSEFEGLEVVIRGLELNIIGIRAPEPLIVRPVAFLPGLECNVERTRLSPAALQCETVRTDC